MWRYVYVCHTHQPRLLCNQDQRCHSQTQAVRPGGPLVYLQDGGARTATDVLKTSSPWASPEASSSAGSPILHICGGDGTDCLFLKIFSLNSYLDHNWRIGTGINFSSSHSMNSLTVLALFPKNRYLCWRDGTDEIRSRRERSAETGDGGRQGCWGSLVSEVSFRPWSLLFVYEIADELLCTYMS